MTAAANAEPSAAELGDLLYDIVRELVGEGPAVHVTETPQPDGAVDFAVDVERPHCGRLVGKHGRTISALRLVFGAIGKRQGMTITVRPINLKDLGGAGGDERSAEAR